MGNCNGALLARFRWRMMSTWAAPARRMRLALVCNLLPMRDRAAGIADVVRLMRVS